MNRRILSLISLAAGSTLLFSSASGGELKWPENAISRSVGFSEERITVKFPVKNEGEHVVKIETVKTSCGCAVAKTTPNQLKPGESAELVIEINTTKTAGESRKYITVKTDEPGLTVYQLSVDILKQIAYLPKVSKMEWEKFNTLGSRTLVIERADGLPEHVEVVRAVSGYPEAISVELNKNDGFDGSAKEISLNLTPLKHGISQMKPINLILKNGEKIINSRLNVSIDVQ